MDIEQEFIRTTFEYKQLIYKVCLIYADSKEDLQDYYQETIFNLWKSYRTFRGECTVSTWIYRVALNTCISDVRKKKYHYVPLETTDVIDNCEHSELIREMYGLIKQLNKSERMFILLWLDGKTYDEIAEITGVCRNNVASRIHRIKEKLKLMSNL